jgi:uncharacterized protein (TIGR04255 family)
MVENPFGDDPVDEVHLPRAPLVHTVCQLRFPKILSLRSEAGIAPLQEALAEDFPVLHQDSNVAVMLLPDGVATQPGTEAVWRFQSKDGSWKVSVSADFISLDTSAYESRADYLRRLESVLAAFGSVVRPAHVERIGIRYIDRIDDPEQFARLASYVRPQMLGGLAVPLPADVHLAHTLSEAVFVGDGSQLLARWGVVGPNMTLDPMVAPSAHRSWILDIDVSAGGQFEFDAGPLAAAVGGFADQIYRFFRWAVTDELLREAGGEL